jgi:uncharacterized delta-60 repeat protein
MPSRLLVAALAALLLFAPSAAAKPDGAPLRLWTVSRIDRGGGIVPVRSGAQAAGVVNETVKLGVAAFDFRGPFVNHADGDIFSSADGSTYSVAATAPSHDPARAGGSEGTLSHLDEFQAYRKQEGDASLKVTISRAVMDAVDGNGDSCRGQHPCPAIRSLVGFHARAYAASAGGDFFDVGGIAFIEGHHADWDAKAGMLAGSRGPAWDHDQFRVFFDWDDSKTFRNAHAELEQPRTLKIPLSSVKTGELFAVHVSLDAGAVAEPGLESGGLAVIRDPQHLFRTHGLKPAGRPRFKEPRERAQRPARCPGGRPRGGGTLQFSGTAYSTDEAVGRPLVLVTRSGGARGAASVTFSTRAGTASAGSDFRATRTTVRFGRGDRTPRLVEVPIREDRALEPAETFTVALAHARCAQLGARKTAKVTILDDDQTDPPPPPAFTVGGMVDGLAGSGLVITDQGSQLHVTANGRFTLPATFRDGSPYDVRVTAQPADQVCMVAHGTGTVHGNVGDVAVHCAPVAASAGLDATFGTGGRVSLPGGTAQAMVLQPDGHIVAAGPVPKDLNFHFKFGAVRVDALGRPDTAFGTGGLASTDLGGNDDKPNDAALLPGGGFVAVGQADPAGLGNIDWGVARYTATGQRDGGFGAGTGFVTTDFAGHGDVAKAVAVQPDGKIVVAGSAQTSAIDGDFAVARDNADGTPDKSFSGDGMVTTNIAGENDDARAVAIQPDGKIVVAGDTDAGIALARYDSKGELDPTFDGDGKAVGPTGEANGVAITPGGSILVAGARGGPHGDLDVMIAGFTTTGKPDAAFGQSGIALTDLSGGFDTADDLVLDSQGRIVVVGSATSATVTDMAVVRYLPTGKLDTSFHGGFVTADFSGFGERGHDVAIDAAGRIVAAGDAAGQFGLMRINP